MGSGADALAYQLQFVIQPAASCGARSSGPSAARPPELVVSIGPTGNGTLDAPDLCPRPRPHKGHAPGRSFGFVGAFADFRHGPPPMPGCAATRGRRRTPAFCRDRLSPTASARDSAPSISAQPEHTLQQARQRHRPAAGHLHRRHQLHRRGPAAVRPHGADAAADARRAGGTVTHGPLSLRGAQPARWGDIAQPGSAHADTGSALSDADDQSALCDSAGGGHAARRPSAADTAAVTVTHQATGAPSMTQTIA
jgi:hypothetical protein